MTTYEKFSDPPITEVICGLIFDAIPEINPLVLGPFWEARRSQFPNHQLQPPISDETTIILTDVLLPTRTWLLSDDDVFVLQIQRDRFYLNWRARGKEYPRFSDHDDKEGLLSRFMKELESFFSFCQERLGRSPTAIRIELAKVDHLVQGVHWRDFPDLAVLLPWLRVFAEASTSSQPEVGFRFSEEQDNGKLTISLNSAVGQKPDKTTFRLIKIESRVMRSVRQDAIRSELVKANGTLNDAFFRMIPKEERAKRFNRSGDKS